MKVLGFTFVRNAQKFDYPVRESLMSLVPLCDAVEIAVGDSEDDTRQWISDLNLPNVHIHDTVWDDSLREGGRVLAVETDKAFSFIPNDTDWVIYLQADEVLHESDYKAIREAMEKYKDVPEVEGLLFHYHHFYGTYDFVGDSRTWYKYEIRILKYHPNIRSYKDAQGFRIDDRKINVVKIPAHVYHYGWVKSPEHQLAKQLSFNKWWHSDAWVDQRFSNAQTFDYSSIDSIKRFEGTHPAIMKERLARLNWTLDFDPTQKKFSLKKRFLYQIEKWTGVRWFDYKNYNLLKF
jgi:hypothetical protein